jgi:hypothetical protein
LTSKAILCNISVILACISSAPDILNNSIYFLNK